MSTHAHACAPYSTISWMRMPSMVIIISVDSCFVSYHLVLSLAQDHDKCAIQRKVKELQNAAVLNFTDMFFFLSFLSFILKITFGLFPHCHMFNTCGCSQKHLTCSESFFRLFHHRFFFCYKSFSVPLSFVQYLNFPNVMHSAHYYLLLLLFFLLKLFDLRIIVAICFEYI